MKLLCLMGLWQESVPLLQRLGKFAATRCARWAHKRKPALKGPD